MQFAWWHPQVSKVAQALFELYEKGREGPAPESVHRYLQLVALQARHGAPPLRGRRLLAGRRAGAAHVPLKVLPDLLDLGVRRAGFAAEGVESTTRVGTQTRQPLELQPGQHAEGTSLSP